MAQREPIKVIERTYSVLFRRDSETRGYIATCRAVRGFVAYGRTLDEARSAAKEALEGCIAALRDRGLPIPRGDASPPRRTRASITVHLPRM